MRIACPQCSTSYVLDEKLLPPTGAPVQCTKCGNVFTASSNGQAPVPPAPVIPTNHRTQIFGAIKSAPSALPGDEAQVSRRTMIFGRGAGAPSPSPSAAPAVSRPAAAAAPIFAQAPAGPPAAAASIAAQPPAAAPAAAPSIAAQPPAAPQHRTMIFGRGPAPAQPAPAAPLHQTMIYGKRGGPPQPPVDLDFAAGAAPAPAAPASVIGLPPEPTGPEPAFAQELVSRPPRPRTPARAPLSRTSRLALLAGAGVVLALLLILAAARELRAVKVRTLDGVLSSLTDATAPLRRDDAASRQEAFVRLDQLRRQHPEFAGATAAYVLAVALEVDDRRAVVHHLERQAAVVNAEVSRLQASRTPGWETAFNAAANQAQLIEQQLAPLKSQLKPLEEELQRAYQALPKGPFERPETELAVARVQALVQAIDGDPQALASIAHDAQLAPRDDWSRIALAEYVVNSTASREAIREASTNLQGVLSDDPSFIRAYVLAARVAELQNNREAAINDLEGAIALNPAHQLARQLLTWEQRAQTPTGD